MAPEEGPEGHRADPSGQKSENSVQKVMDEMRQLELNGQGRETWNQDSQRDDLFQGQESWGHIMQADDSQHQEPSLQENSNNHADNKPEMPSSTPTGRGIVTLKLDSISLPDFDGDLTSWEAFRDIFEYLVHSSKKLTNVIKFHQLRTHLKGEAFDTIRGYPLMGANYEIAWEDVKKRYDRPEDIIDAYIKRFMEVPTVTHHATTKALRLIVDTTNQMLRVMPTFNIQTANWDPFVTFIIEQKLDEKTRMEWRQKRGPHTKADMKVMLEWLERRASELEPFSCDMFNKNRNHKRQ